MEDEKHYILTSSFGQHMKILREINAKFRKTVFVSGCEVFILDQLQKEAAAERRSLIKFLPFLHWLGKLFHL